MLANIRVFLKEIRVEHTLFALPFAYVGAVMAARGLPTTYQLFWITLAVIGAQSTHREAGSRQRRAGSISDAVGDRVRAGPARS
jgi:hypothetical protein